MINTKQNSFIKSDKVIRYKLGSKSADTLAVLIYKYEYWKSQSKLVYIDGIGYFFISLNDLKAETGYTKNVIAKNISLLKQARLVQSIRQGLNKPNRYSVDQKVIDDYIDRYRGELEKWEKDTRENLVTSGGERKCEKRISRITKRCIQKTSKECATKNKNTKNKNTENNITNRASSGSEIDLEYRLEEKISNLRSCDDQEGGQEVVSLFRLLCSLVESFKGFKMSENDRELILKLTESEIEEYKLVSKITSNAFDIIEGRKESRFGSLFVGVNEMISNYDKITA